MLVREIEGFIDWEEPERLYPAADPGVGDQIPAAIAHAVEEAQSCFRHQEYTAAALMCRRALECIAAEHSINTRNLNSSLAKMREKGIIEAKLYEWADTLRIVGNEAAHALDRPVSAEDASDTIDFTRALIEYVFTYQDKFSAFMARRRNGSTPA